MGKKYLILPGSVKSSFEGETHYIGFYHLCRLYQVKPKECVNGDYALRNFGPEVLTQLSRTLITLRPRVSGDYIEHRKKLEQEFTMEFKNDVEALSLIDKNFYVWRNGIYPRTEGVVANHAEQAAINYLTLEWRYVSKDIDWQTFAKTYDGE